MGWVPDTTMATTPPLLLTEPELVALSDTLASSAPSVASVHLNGPLGAGKTTFVRAFLRALGVTGPVRSPTYTLMEPYAIDRVGGPEQVMHLDLYRLGGADELEYLGLRDELAQALVLIEWPERAEGALPEPDLVLDLDYAETANGLPARTVMFSASESVGRPWLERAGILLDRIDASS